MQLVIDIPDDEYKILVNPYQHNEKKCERLKRIVMNGTPLPPHGRLIDADYITKDFDTFKESFSTVVDIAKGITGICCLAPTILKANETELKRIKNE